MAAERVGVVLGTTLAGMRRAAAFFRDQPGGREGMQRFLAMPIAAAVADACGAEGARGLCVSVSAACASGLTSLAHAACLLRSGVVDVCVAGGYDPVSEYAYGGFHSLRLVAGDTIRPFTRDRQGMKLGEGYALLILERASSAAERGATVLAELAAVGESSDAHHLTNPDPEGKGLSRAIRLALQRADLTPNDIDLISLHGTGTPANDLAEHQALGNVFGEGLADLSAVAYKAACGHTLGAAGTLELTLTAHALAEGVAPPTATITRDTLEYPAIGLREPHPHPAPPVLIRHTLNLSLGFGGSNAAAILRPPPALPAPADMPPTLTPRPLRITGTGYFGSHAPSLAALRDRWFDPPADHPATPPPLDEAALADRAGGRRSRRMSTYARLLLAAGREACDAAPPLSDADRDTCAVIVGSAHGASQYSEDYYRQLVADGVLAANPLWFAEGVPNVGSAHLSTELHLGGTAQTVIGTRVAGLQALALAFHRLREREAEGGWPRVLVAAADEHSELAASLYHHAHLHAPPHGSLGPATARTGFVTAHAAAALVLDPASSADAPGLTLAACSQRRGPATVRGLADTVDRVLRDLGDPDAVLLSGNATWLTTAELRGTSRSASRRLTADASAPPTRISFTFGPAARALRRWPAAGRRRPRRIRLPAPRRRSVPSRPPRRALPRTHRRRPRRRPRHRLPRRSRRRPPRPRLHLPVTELESRRPGSELF